ncbi:MAG: hypothetical protein CL874_05365 [Dehalococcoidales bacterium]|jgi:hypothetical protein|nr:hypothetical protein [Dehalococcoidales bacterium]MDP6448772.1 divalent cation tolerance protein CutA [Dehalococcoidales bacterium]MDP6576682.1 divalent cation tolerance protein CutA [Dehalococcoidales bacterium]MDP6825022.1 divalent cation tolerance protein CutA [Dehalococcoidales bacterium]
MEASYVALFITMDNTEEARQISRVLLEQKKAACVNIIANVDSCSNRKARYIPLGQTYSSSRRRHHYSPRLSN